MMTHNGTKIIPNNFSIIKFFSLICLRNFSFQEIIFKGRKFIKNFIQKTFFMSILFEDISRVYAWVILTTSFLWRKKIHGKKINLCNLSRFELCVVRTHALLWYCRYREFHLTNRVSFDVWEWTLWAPILK